MTTKEWLGVLMPVGIFAAGIIIKLARDVGRLEGEVNAMSRVLEKDRREDRRSLANGHGKKRGGVLRNIIGKD